MASVRAHRGTDTDTRGQENAIGCRQRHVNTLTFSQDRHRQAVPYARLRLHDCPASTARVIDGTGTRKTGAPCAPHAPLTHTSHTHAHEHSHKSTLFREYSATASAAQCAPAPRNGNREQEQQQQQAEAGAFLRDALPLAITRKRVEARGTSGLCVGFDFAWLQRRPRLRVPRESEDSGSSKHGNLDRKNDNNIVLQVRNRLTRRTHMTNYSVCGHGRSVQ